ncbi:hypothetical protein M2272_000053 [Mycobacterium frederiksbergense]|uniref:Uncharacterized protein n=1 Tax=Mycolicibacterium frederiksbergense TaxID=117567 RepID=A0ABT6KRS1_9MYCO|nr:hypothetical protein [Mycolicibacterium frederiksbergense]MDH6193432.1 hypothetical protein [Mycolicibacterium frederiksbergense]
MSQENDRGAMLSVAALAAMVIAYLLAFTVLTDTDVASKFENGVAPPGTDVAGLRAAAFASIVAAAGAWVTAVASRKAVPVVLVVFACVPFSPLALFALGLAF